MFEAWKIFCPYLAQSTAVSHESGHANACPEMSWEAAVLWAKYGKITTSAYFDMCNQVGKTSVNSFELKCIKSTLQCHWRGDKPLFGTYARFDVNIIPDQIHGLFSDYSPEF